jgi:hypothetical protein
MEVIVEIGCVGYYMVVWRSVGLDEMGCIDKEVGMGYIKGILF